MSQQSLKFGALSSPMQKRPTALEWSRDQVLHLIELYHSQPALWNSADVKFKDRQVKRWALMTIASQLSLPPIDVEKKIHCLRTQFNREYLKMKTNARKPTWFAYQPLSFVLRNKQEASFDTSQWHPASLNIKEEFMDEFDRDDIEERLLSADHPNTNIPRCDIDASHITDSNCTSSDNINDDNSRVYYSMNELKTSSAVEVILHEQIDIEQSPNQKLNGKRQSTSRSGQPVINVHSSSPSSPMACNDNEHSRNERNNMFAVNDELALFGKLLTDELFRVDDYFTLQLAKYEISKIIFRATTGSYDKGAGNEDKFEENKWNFNKSTFKNCKNRQTDNYNRMSTVGELRIFSNVVVNELSVVNDMFALQAAKFYINRVLFHATTAGLTPSPTTSYPPSPVTEALQPH